MNFRRRCINVRLGLTFWGLCGNVCNTSEQDKRSVQEKRGFPPTEGVTLSGVRPTGLGRGLYVDVTLEKLDERVPKVQCGTGSAPVNLSGKRTETKKAPLLCPMGPAGGCFFRNVFGPWSVLHGLFFVQKRRGIHHVRVFGSGTVPHCSQHQYLFVQLYSGLSAHPVSYTHLTLPTKA